MLPMKRKVTIKEIVLKSDSDQIINSKVSINYPSYCMR